MGKLKMPREGECIWLLLGARGGDNAQVKAIATHLELPLVEKYLTYNALHVLPNLAKGASIFSLDPKSRQEIRPPWPRMVVAVGKRSVPVARYIKKQSGGITRLVQLGRPRANLDNFDLVLTTPQYGLLAGEHVLELSVPPSALINAGDADNADGQKQFGAGKPRPYIVMIAGGDSTTATFTDEAAKNLAHLVQKRATDLDGSVFALTSPRTPESVVKTLQTAFEEPATLIAWIQPEKGQANPYAALLAMADEVIVTSDSASMIADGLALNKPVMIFQLPAGWQGRLSSAIVSVFTKLDRLSNNKGALILLLSPWRVLRKYGVINPPRQMDLLIDRLFENGLASPFPSSEPSAFNDTKNPDIPVPFDQAVDRIKSLLK